MLVPLFLSGVFFFSRKNKKAEEEDAEDQRNHTFSCRFVYDGMNRKIGESITLDKDILIIKSGKRYRGVPMKHIEDQGKALLVKGLVDFDQAELMGEKWRRESSRDFDQLSEDEGQSDGF